LDPNQQEDVRIFCAVYTSAKSTKLQRAQYNTWGKRCNDFKFFSNKDDEKLPTIVIAPEHGPESYENMYHKVRAIWKHIAQMYLDDFDYFWLSGDDVFVIVENLRRYLHSKKVKCAADKDRPLFVGRRLRQSTPLEWLETTNSSDYPYDTRFAGTVYNSGGAGYVLNSHAVRKLVANFEATACFPFELTPSEDLRIGHCLHAIGIDPMDTRDVGNKERW
jgi:glycoprotein-N-acetylgalactosamine 3-beta-galactosyltransferase